MEQRSTGGVRRGTVATIVLAGALLALNAPGAFDSGDEARRCERVRHR